MLPEIRRDSSAASAGKAYYTITFTSCTRSGGDMVYSSGDNVACGGGGVQCAVVVCSGGGVQCAVVIGDVQW